MEEKLKQNMKGFMTDVAALAKRAREPYDPRIEALLEVVHSLVKEQIELDKKYAWGPRPQQDDEFVDDTDAPSADDLRKRWEVDNDT